MTQGETAEGAKGTVIPDALTAHERQLVAAFRRLDPAQQRILWNALQHLASGVPGARLVLAVER